VKFRLAFLAGSVLLLLQFKTNFLGTAPRDAFPRFQWDSAALVERRIDETHATGRMTKGGFLVRIQPAAGEPYLSQYGLQGRLFAPMALVWPWSRASFFDFLRWLCAAAAAAVFMLWIAAVAREFGPWTAAGVWLLVLCSSWIVLFAPNVYWIFFSHLLPMIAVWWLLARRPGFPVGWLGAIFGALVLFKCLSGYEYLSNLVASGVPPYAYYAMKRRTSFRVFARNALWITACGVAGFLFAAFVHVHQVRTLTGSWSSGIEAIRERAAARTFGSSGFGHAPAESNVLEIATRYGELAVLVPPGPPIVNELAEITLLTALLLWIIAVIVAFRSGSDTLRHLAVMSMLALCASFSWVFLAKGHMFYHLHINAIVFHFPWLLTAYVLWVHTVVRLSTSSEPRGAEITAAASR
jgi:hypothetical protein